MERSKYVSKARKVLSPEEKDAIVARYQEGVGSDTVGKEFGIHPNTVLRILKEKGVGSRGVLKETVSKEDQLKIVHLYQSGFSAPEIEEMYDLTHTTIRKYLRKNGIQIRDAEECRRKYPIKKDFFDKIDTQEKAYFLGMLYADGCNLQEHNFVRLSLHIEDKTILECKRRRKITSKPKVEYIRETHDVYFNINSKYICEQLSKLGCTSRKSLTLKFPEWLTDPNLQRHFIRGYYDGDGGIYLSKDGSRVASTKIVASKEFLGKMSEIIKEQTGIQFGAIYDTNHNNGIYQTSICGNRIVAHFLDWLYYGSTIHMDRKYLLYQKLLSKNEETDEIIAAGTRGYSKSNYEKFKKPKNWDGSFLQWKHDLTQNQVDNDEISVDFLPNEDLLDEDILSEEIS